MTTFPVIDDIGVTATQSGMTPAQEETARTIVEFYARLLREAKGRRLILHHGDCVGGDAQFDAIAHEVMGGKPTWIHPPRDEKLRAFCENFGYRELPLPYLDRNREIVAASGALIGAPKNFIMPKSTRGSGTWTTIKYGIAKQKIEGVYPVHIVYPDGTVSLPVH